ncbi:MAG: hypothetical protein R3E88_11015 [Myxococcota bacterium]
MTDARLRRRAMALARTLAVAIALCAGAPANAAPDDAAPAASAPDDDARTTTAERGPVVAVVRVSPRAPVIGDVVTLELEVRAEPDVELLMPAFGEALGRFDIVDFAPREEIDASGATIARQTYRLQPARSGTQTIPPLLVEFVDRRAGRAPAPEGEDAYELLTDRIDLEVGSVLPEGAPLALRPAIGALPARGEPLAPWWAWALGALALAGAAAPFAWRAWQGALARGRRRSAYEVARAELDALLYAGRPTATTMDAFFVRLSLIVRTYLEDRFGLRSPELTTEEFLQVMGRSPDLARSHQLLLREFLVLADLVKFAGHLPADEDVTRSIQAAERFLEETRHQAQGGEEAAHA